MFLFLLDGFLFLGLHFESLRLIVFFDILLETAQRNINFLHFFEVLGVELEQRISLATFKP